MCWKSGDATVALFFTRLHTEEHRASFMLAAVSNLCTTFQDQVDTRRHLPWLSWGRLWLPLTVEASRASLRTFMAGLDIEDPLASSQQSPPVVATVPEPSNNREGRGRGASPAVDHSSKLDPSPPDGDDDLQDSTDSAGSDDGKINEETPARPTSASRAKRPRELSPQVDTRPSNDQMHSLPTNRSSKRSRLSSFRTFSHKGRSSDELMQHYDLRDPCEVSSSSLLNFAHAKTLFCCRWCANARDARQSARRSPASPYFV
ncbi:hypothetical protein EDB19DRAFT_172586 [Suillus lakei]|nr:hypothetical protein EDB19DRAFT_172586 [Suillus lakei]